MSESNLGSKQDKINSEELVQDKEDKRKRRTRNDDDGRNFSCSCGKSYLSYPALYTHIKTKHNGKSEFTKSINAKEEQSYDAKENDEISETEKYEDTNNMDLLKKYLTKFFPFSQKEREADKKIKQISKEDQIYIKGIKQYWQKHKKEDQPQLN